MNRLLVYMHTYAAIQDLYIRYRRMIYTARLTSAVLQVSFSAGSAPFNCFRAISTHVGSRGTRLFPPPSFSSSSPPPSPASLLRLLVASEAWKKFRLGTTHTGPAQIPLTAAGIPFREILAHLKRLMAADQST